MIENPGNSSTKINFSSGSFKKYLANTSWLFFEKILRLIISFVVTIYVVRYLGPKDFGLYSYVISFFWLFGAIATLGIESITVREIVNHPEKTDEINGTVFILRLLGGLTAIILIAATVLLSGEEFDTSILIIIASVSFIFQSFSVIEYYFRAIVKAKYNAYALSASVVCSSLFKIILIYIKAPLVYFIAAFTFEYFVLAIGLLIVYRKNKLNIFSWKFSKQLSKSLMKDSWPLMLSGVVVMIYVRIDQIMIKHMISDEAVGYYAAAARLCEAWYFIPVTLCNSIFPAIVNAKKVSEEFYNNRLQKLYDLLAWIAIGIAVPVTIFSDQIIDIIFGNEFITSSPVLTIYIWAGVAVFLGVASSQYLVNENFNKISMSKNAMGMLANVVLNIILIPIYGINGAAFATVISYILSVFLIGIFPATKKQLYLMFKALIFLDLIKAVRKYIEK